jgi:hypothetical protein
VGALYPYLELLTTMKPYLLVLAAFVFISSFLWVPDVYAQFGGGMGGGMGGAGGRHGGSERAKGCENADKPSGNKGPMGAQEPMSREQLEYHLGTLQYWHWKPTWHAKGSAAPARRRPLQQPQAPSNPLPMPWMPRAIC